MFIESEKISVIIPIYNMENCLEQCVESVRKQTYKNLEIILVDDGSIDTSSSICDEFAKKDTRIKAFHKKNGGPSSARNFGMDNMTGKYFMFVDSDDILYCDALEKMFNAIITNNVDEVIANIKIVKSNKIIVYKTLTTGIYTDIDFLNFVFLYSGYWGPCAKLIKTDLVKNNIKFEEDIFASEDMLFFVQQILWIKKIYMMNEVVYEYVKRNGSLTTSKFSNKRKTDLYAFEKAYDILLECNNKKLLQNFSYAFYEYNYYLMRKAYISGDKEFYNIVKKELKDKYEVWKSKASKIKVIKHKIIEILMNFSIPPKVLNFILFGMKR